MNNARKKPTREQFAEWVAAGLTADDIRSITGASLGRISAWGTGWNLKPTRGAWGGNRKADYVPQEACKAVVRPEATDMTATPGRLSYWQSQGLWMMGEAA